MLFLPPPVVCLTKSVQLGFKALKQRLVGRSWPTCTPHGSCHKRCLKLLALACQLHALPGLRAPVSLCSASAPSEHEYRDTGTSEA